MLNEMKFRLLSGKNMIVLLSIILFFSCSKNEPSIAWEKEITFAEILESAGEKYVMIDFIKDG